MKITAIELKDFRAFANGYRFAFSGKQSLIVYGENGSGKSSLFQAFAEFFNTRDKAKPFEDFRNIFTDPPGTDGYVAVHFDHGEPAVWSCGNARPKADQRVSQTALRTGYVDYRALLKTHFVHFGEKVNLFRLVVGDLLANYPLLMPGGRSSSIGALWRWVESNKPRNRHGSNIERARRAAEHFNMAVRPELPKLAAKAEELLAKFPGCNLGLQFDFPGVACNEALKDFVGQEINLSVSLNSRNVMGHHYFLNEARLSAIALALYFAGLLLSVPAAAPNAPDYPRVLVLDDVLIGLDLANRLPVLRVIEKEFVDAGWQVLLLTFDRAWYEIAKQQLRTAKWRYQELFTMRVGDHEQPLLIPDEDHLYRALAFLDNGQVKAASVHVRAAFEVVLKYACHKLGIAVKFQLEPRKVPASVLWGALKSAEYEVASLPQYHFGPKGKNQWWQPKSNRPIVPPVLASRIDPAVSWVLNPLAHSESVDRYRVEVDDAIYAVDELESAVDRAIELRSACFAALLEMLLALLKIHSERLGSADPGAATQQEVMST